MPVPIIDRNREAIRWILRNKADTSWWVRWVTTLSGGTALPSSSRAAVQAGGEGRAPQTPEPPNLAELSEKDVMNVLGIVRGEFDIDNNRTYLMGHSMGGAGALFLGPKYVDQWAAVGL